MNKIDPNQEQNDTITTSQPPNQWGVNASQGLELEAVSAQSEGPQGFLVSKTLLDPASECPALGAPSRSQVRNFMFSFSCLLLTSLGDYFPSLRLDYKTAIGKCQNWRGLRSHLINLLFYSEAQRIRK